MSVVPLNGSPEVLVIGIRPDGVPQVKELIDQTGVDLTQFAGHEGIIAETVRATVRDNGRVNPVQWLGAVENLYERVTPIRESLKGRDAGDFTVANVAPVLPNPDWKRTASNAGRIMYGNGKSRFLFLSAAELVDAGLPGKKTFFRQGVGELALGIRVNEPLRSGWTRYDDLPEWELEERRRRHRPSYLFGY